jgi:hypothetical protein
MKSKTWETCAAFAPRLSPVPMPMTVVREVRVPLEHRLVVMLVGMRFFALRAHLVRMSVVRIVNMRVGVSDRFVQKSAMAIAVPTNGAVAK